MTTIISFLLSFIMTFGLYPKTVMVNTVTPEPDQTCIVEFIDCNGDGWEYASDDCDFEPGECYTLIMYSNRTSTIYDDIILIVRYERIDLLMEAA